MGQIMQNIASHGAVQTKFRPTMARMTGADTPPISILLPTLRLICPPAPIDWFTPFRLVRLHHGEKKIYNLSVLGVSYMSWGWDHILANPLFLDHVCFTSFFNPLGTDLTNSYIPGHHGTFCFHLKNHTSLKSILRSLRVDIATTEAMNSLIYVIAKNWYAVWIPRFFVVSK
jgi:hypothetical protein